MAIHTSLTAGLDVGNGYLKGLIESDEGGRSSIDAPSGVTIVTRPNFLPTPDAEALATVKDDFFNNLDASFTTPLVSSPYRHLFGKRGIGADGIYDEFDVNGKASKADDQLSRVLVLGSFAAKALIDHVTANKTLPDDQINVRARVALALPITEYTLHRAAYRAAFLDDSHLVTIHNFSSPVNVRITFTDVDVLPEGGTAQFAIMQRGTSLMKAMLRDTREHMAAAGVSNPLEGITAADVLGARQTIGIDIGEGTVNFPVFKDGRFNPDVSTTFPKGYGNVLTDAMADMVAQGNDAGFASRKQLGEYLQAGPSPLKRAMYTRVSAAVRESEEFFCSAVAEQFGHVLAKVGATAEVVYVYGGGSGPVKDILYPKLVDKVAEMMGSADAVIVLYLDASYSRNLNREGLLIAAEAGRKR